ncbi:hypothetical protein OV203_06735 [Nannocystis sp. ILAH1]|uniref:hypothetical protein n=1 Tax=unclassified Nannocystis TaxID=2627009 RepID=UPI00226FB7C3|nr:MULTISPECIES: hypothetical protein [unclassified Nannocystis]MCY0986809.1 hypothetical protein [Nannocystis sp. ILAH1]MCY1071690.1 hypothetical protein [Nannocystis sp. RBIL2]
MSLLLFACGTGKDATATAATEASGDDGTAATGIATDPTETPDTTANSVTMPPDTETTGEPLAPDCACLADEATCGEELCPGVGLSCEEPACEPDHPVNDEGALACALEALRDRKPGKVSWFIQESLGQYAYDTSVYIQADGNAIVTRSGGADLCSYWGPDTRNTLKETTYFADCLDLATGRERFDCLTDGLGDELLVCIPEEQNCES